MAACAETGTVINLHVGSAGASPNTTDDAPPDVTGVLFFAYAMFAAVDWLYSGYPTKHPDLKICLSEGGIGWVAGLIDRLDHMESYNSMYGTWTDELRPSEVFRRNFWFCAIEDPSSFRQRDVIGVENIMIEQDYPHIDSTWPRTQQLTVEAMAGIPAAEVAADLLEQRRRAVPPPRSPEPSRTIPMPTEVPNRVAVVTGASRSIGKGIALELGAAGATVYVTGRTVEPGALAGTIGETAAEIDALGGHGIAVACDHKDDAQVEALFARVAEEQGRLDVLVNNVFPAPVLAPWLGKKYWELPIEAWDEIIGVGSRSHYVASVYATPLLFAAGGGLIVNVSSSGAVTYAHNVVYGVGKAAVDKMTSDMAVELDGTGVVGRVALARSRAHRDARGRRRPRRRRDLHRAARRRALRPDRTRSRRGSSAGRSSPSPTTPASPLARGRPSPSAGPGP